MSVAEFPPGIWYARSGRTHAEPGVAGLYADRVNGRPDYGSKLMSITMVVTLIPSLCLLLDPLVHLDSWTEGLHSPARIALTADGTVYVTDPFFNHIARYDSEGTLLSTWSVPEGPIGIAVHPSNGNYYVSLRDEGKVGIYTYDGDAETFTRTGFLGEGEPMVAFVRPTDLDIADATGRIFVVDPEGDRWYMFNADGTLRAMGGERGEMSGQFKYPSAICVDEGRSRMIVADHDNFRVQIFSLTDDGDFTYATFETKFGYRMKYQPDGEMEGWTPRPQGLAVDAEGHIYLTDALMGSVRIFEDTGSDLGKVVEHAYNGGELHVPCDIALSADGSLLYVVSTNSSSVELYATPDDFGGGRGGLPDDGPFDAPGTNACAFSLLLPGGAGSVRWLRDGGRPVKGWPYVAPWAFPWDGDPWLTGLRDSPGYDGPHMVEGRVICGRCHGISDQPGGHVGLLDGQVNLCMSCHSGGGQALAAGVHALDLADPFGTNPNAADGRGRSHAWGVLAISESADSVGPAPGGPMALYLDEGRMKCSTCHQQHNSDAGLPYLRMGNDHDQMCKECHAPRDEGPGERGTHAVGFDYPGGVGEFPPDGDISPMYLKEDNVECMTCHGPHDTGSGGANDGAGDGMLLRAANDDTLCRTCHSEHSMHDVGGPWQPTCTDCHDVHDPESENLTLVAREINATPMTFQDNDIGDDGLTDFIHSNHDPAGYDGMCEVCHTSTTYHRNNAEGNHDHNIETLCADCHPHTSGFLPTGGSCTACHGQPPDSQPPIGDVFPNRAGSHATHMGGVHGPNITSCFDCHSTLSGGTHQNDQASFATGTDANGDDNIDLSETDVCDACHSPDGAYDGVNAPAFGAKANWADGIYEAGSLPADKAEWCAGCHDMGTSVIQGVDAPPVAGDDSTWGYYTSGHGRSGIVACTDCHDPQTPHIDGNARTYEVSPTGVVNPYTGSYRLTIGLDVPRPSTGQQEPEVERYELCFSCHHPDVVLGDPLLDPAGDFYRENYATNFRHDPLGYGSWGHGGNGVVMLETATETSLVFDWWQEDTGRGSPGSERSYLLPDINQTEFIYEVLDPNNWEPWFYQDPVDVVPGSTMLSDNPALWNGGQTAYAFGLPNSHYFHLSNIGGWWDWDSDWDGEFGENGYESTRSCPTCHNVHGSTYRGMIRDGQLVGVTGLQFGVDPDVPEEGSFIIPYESGTCTGVCHSQWTPGGDVPRPIYWYREEIPMGTGCAMCHGRAVDNGDGVPPGGRRPIVDEFGYSSHHVQAEIQTSDCLVCHELATHANGYLQLKNVDTSFVYDEPTPGAFRPENISVANSKTLASFCLGCHDSDGADGDTTPFSDGRTVPVVDNTSWNQSAHNTGGTYNAGYGCLGDGTGTGCHATGHGSNLQNLLAPSTGEPGTDNTNEEEGFCYGCHTEGMVMNDAVSGPGLADDIEQAFAIGGANQRHSVRDSEADHTFIVGANTYELECTTCHNPHVVTGKYWEADQDKSPVTRPDFSDPTNNSVAMGTVLWGDGAGEKMADYVGGGTYRTPNGDPFSGSQLPDYVSFCQDCHAGMPAPSPANPGSHGGISWGGAANHHGTDSANVPNGGGLVPDWYTCGKFVGAGGIYGGPTQWPILPRGKGEQIWSRGPYNQEERIAGANFVLSCTDCHEGHGSAVRSMIRSKLNDRDGSGTTIWNSSCNACHYYYSNWHAGMSCGNASCHVSDGSDRMYWTGTDTPHDMGHRSGDGSIRIFEQDLVLDMRFENNLSDSSTWRMHGRWDPDGGTGGYVTGHGGSGKAIEVNGQFVEPGTRDGDWSNNLGAHGTHIYLENKYNLSVEGWIYPTVYDRNVHVIMSNGPSNSNYRLQLQNIGGDYHVVFQVNVNGDSAQSDSYGWRGAYSTVPISLDRWTHVAATYDASQYGDDYDANDLSQGRIRIYVDGLDVTTNNPFSTNNYWLSQPADGEGEGEPPLTGSGLFVHSDNNCGGYPCGWRFTIGSRPYESSLDDFKGRIDEVKVWNITKPVSYFDALIPPRITRADGVLGYDRLYVTFNEGVYANTDGTGDLAPGAFTLTDVDDGRTISGVTHTAGDATAELILSAPLDDGSDIGIDALAATADSVYDLYATPATTDPVEITALADAPAITVVQGVEGHPKLAVWFSERVYANPDATGALQPADFVFTDAGAGKSIVAVDQTPGKPTATLTLDNPIEAADIGGAALAAAGGAVFDITGYPAHTTTADVTGASPSFIAAVVGVVGNPTVKVTFETQVYANNDETGALEPSDLTLSAGGKSILTVQHAAGNPIAIITMDGDLDGGDLVDGTLAAASNSIFGPSSGNFPLTTDTVDISAQAAPTITRVEGAVGYDQVFVSFTEGVYAEADGTGALDVLDFTFTDGNVGGAASITGVVHTAGRSSAIITVDASLITGDIGSDEIAAVSGEIFNSIGNPVGTGSMALIGNDCPAWGTSFPIEDEPQYSPTTVDETGLLIGTVNNPTFAFPDVDNDWFNGDEDEDTYVDFAANNTCLNSPRAITIEARVRPTEVDRGVGGENNTFNRVFERRRTILVTILNTGYRGDDVPARGGKASIEVKYRVDSASRHTCPHPQWPADPHTGNDARMHQISSDIDQFPIVDNHWYQIKVVFNSDKSDVAGSNGTPVDIFIDDQGTNGDDSDQNWVGYKNATVAINESSSCKWGALPGDFLEFRNDTSHIGSSWSHAQLFEGQIDWVTWQPVADYSGVDDAPH